MKFLDLFAGIGGFRTGIEAAGHECVGFCEIDKFARTSYKAIHNTEGEIELHDITAVTDDAIRGIGRVDIICGGFPCQAFSIAGKRNGFKDTRGTLFFDIARFADIIRPRYLFLENVKGLLNHDNGRTFRVILSTLDELGYNVEWQVLNSKDYGVPQNRERVFIIGHLRGASTRAVFPIGGESSHIHIEQGIINRIGSTKPKDSTSLGTRHIVYGDGILGSLEATDYKKPKQVCVKVRGKLDIRFETSSRVYDESGISQTLSTMQGGDPVPKVYKVREATSKGYAEATYGDSIDTVFPNSTTRRGRVGKGIANTITTSSALSVVDKDFRIRYLTPKECWRLQGFSDEAFEKAEKVNSNSQLYKQAGNSVTVPVIYEIARRLQ